MRDNIEQQTMDFVQQLIDGETILPCYELNFLDDKTMYSLSDCPSYGSSDCPLTMNDENIECCETVSALKELFHFHR